MLNRSPKGLAVVLILALGCMGSSLAVAGTEQGTATSDYAGVLSGASRDKTIHFTVERRGGKNVRALFRATEVPLVCEDGTFPRIRQPVMKIRFLSRTVFQGQRYERDVDGDWSYYEVKGRLKGDGRAVGYLYYIEDPFDPPGTENEPECSTGGQLYAGWKAERVR